MIHSCPIDSIANSYSNKFLIDITKHKTEIVYEQKQS